MSDLDLRARAEIELINGQPPRHPNITAKVLAGHAALARMNQGIRASELEHLELPPDYFEFVDGHAAIYWGGDALLIRLRDVKTFADVLRWVVHMGQNNYPLMTPDALARFAEALCANRGLPLHSED